MMLDSAAFVFGFLVSATTGIGLAVCAWLARERHARVALALWISGALLFVAGLYGLSDALCGNGACN